MQTILTENKSMFAQDPGWAKSVEELERGTAKG